MSSENNLLRRRQWRYLPLLLGLLTGVDLGGDLGVDVNLRLDVIELLATVFASLVDVNNPPGCLLSAGGRRKLSGRLALAGQFTWIERRAEELHSRRSVPETPAQGH